MTGARLFGLLAVVLLAAPAAFAVAPAPPAEHGHAHGEEAHGEEAHGEHGDAHAGAHGDDAHGGGHGGAGEVNFADFSYKDEHKNPPLILALINFGLLLALLGWKAVPALRDYWSKKSDSIRDGLEEGARLRKEAEEKLEEYTRRIKDVDAEVTALIEDIRAEADAEKTRILADAKAQAEATKKAADERIAAEIQQARTEIEREVVGAAIAAAEKLLNEKVGAKDHEGLATSFISSLDASARSTTHTGSPS